MMINIPRLSFAHLPTPIEPLERLGAYLGGLKLWIKRDDQTGLAFGGNKTRKLEFLLAEARAHGARTLITAGAEQSNHCRQTAAAAAKFGFDCILVLSFTEEDGIPDSPSGNLLLDQTFGAEIVWSERSERADILQSTFNNAWEGGRRPYLIPVGGSNPTGAAGYTFALQELLTQTAPGSNLPLPDWIVIASSSGGTQAGLVAGASLFDYGGKILGISIDEEEHFLRQLVANLASQTCDLLVNPRQFLSQNILVNSNYLGAGYGVMGDLEKEAIRLFATKEGILLDPVYTGRAAGGLMDLIHQGFFPPDANVLFWHTGGGPALFAENYQRILRT